MILQFMFSFLMISVGMAVGVGGIKLGFLWLIDMVPEAKKGVWANSILWMLVSMAMIGIGIVTMPEADPEVIPKHYSTS